MGQLEATPNIAQLLVVQEAEHFFLITNTHLFWRPDFDSLRALQAHRLRKRIDSLITELNLNPDSLMIIMCGGKSQTQQSRTNLSSDCRLEFGSQEPYLSSADGC